MNKIMLLALLLTAGMSFTACGSDDNTTKPADTGTPSADDLVVDEMSVFQERVITVDDAGNLKGVNVGTVIDEGEPTVFCTVADGIDDAKAKFMELVEDFKDVRISGNNITVVLKDGDGKEQGRVLFNEGSGDEIAEMTYEGFTLPGFTMLKYMSRLPASNATSRWALYQILTVPSMNEGNPRGVCIREYSPGTNGMIICPTAYESGYQDWRANTCVETLKAMGRQVAALGVDKVKARLDQAGIYSDLNKYYWSNTTKFYFFDKGHWKVRLSDGDDSYVSSWEVALSKNNANNCYTYYFDKDGHCW